MVSCVDDSSMEDATTANAPKDFVCPITTRIFDDPVTLETGQTYERSAIQEWVDRGNLTCPITRHKLHTPDLPKTNYVLKRLIATWRERNDTSPKSVIGQPAPASDGELKLAIADVCTSEILQDAEAAVLRIQRCWREAETEADQQMMLEMLTKPPVINGFVEMLLNSVDERVLRTTVFLLTELGSRDDNVVVTLTRVDSDVECIVQLFKKGLHEALVLVYLLRPPVESLVEMELPGYLVDTLSNTHNNNDLNFKMFIEPQTAAVLMLAQIVRSCSQESSSRIATSIASTPSSIERIVTALQVPQTEERVAAVSILLRCILEDGKCRNIVAHKAELVSLLEILFQVGDVERLEIIHFFSELIKLNR